MSAACLKSLASDPSLGRGRRLPEPAAPTRNDYQRDRDRVVHCTAFRRLVYKTQVFLNHEGDLFRTRLTHSLEVAQLARSMARSLGLHEDLVEAIALAHDLGHTPFGHAGQDALHDCMREHGGFEHNLQSLRVVDTLEERYAAFDGLNLCFETREGILKHCSQRHAQELERAEPGGVGSRFLARTQPSLEAQLCNLADEIAYNAHDIDDGVRSGLLHIDQLDDLPLLRELRLQAITEHPNLAGRRLLFEVVRRLINRMVADVLAATQASVVASGATSVDEARRAGPLVCFSAPMRQASDELKHFLMRHLYRHEQVMASMARAKDVVRVLFSTYEASPERMAPGFAQRPDRHRAIADYIAGMTDRFALKEYARWTGRDAMAGLPAAGGSADGADDGADDDAGASDRTVLLDMQRWLQTAVIELNLCPFAKAVHTKGLIHWQVSSARRPKEVLKELRAALLELHELSPDVRDTSLLVLPHALHDFLAFNDLLDAADALLHEMGLEGVIQIASFHPDYVFADAPPDDPAHCSNRAPYPTLHLLREDSLTRAVDAMDDPDRIYLNNIERLRALGWDGWRALDVGIGCGARHPVVSAQSEAKGGE